MSHCLSNDGYTKLAKAQPALRYGSASTGSFAAAKATATAAATPVHDASAALADQSVSAQEILMRSVAQEITDRIQNRAGVSGSLLTERDTIPATAIYTFVWRKKSNDPASANDTTPEEPQPVSFSKDALQRMFCDKLELDKPQYVHSIHITDVYSSAPYPLNFTMDGIQNNLVEREFANDGTGTTMLLMPGHRWSGEKEVYRLQIDDADKLRALKKHGNANIDEEMSALVALPGSDHVMVRPTSRIGRILKKNEERVCEGGKLEVLDVQKIPLYAVQEAKVLEILDRFNNEVISSLPKSDLTKHSARLTRADRSTKEADTKEFADSSDAPNMSKSALDAAHREKFMVIVKARINVIDPAKLEDIADE